MKHFKIDEFVKSQTATAQSIANVPSAEGLKNLETLVHCVLDPLREAWGAPIIVTSGYRCPVLNARVGGAKNSYHLQGMAADIRPQNGFVDKLYLLIGHLFATRKMGITECYIDRAKGYIHIAYDPDNYCMCPFFS